MKETDETLEGEVGWLTRLMPKNAFEASAELDLSTDEALTEFENAAGRVGQVSGRKVSDSEIRLTVVVAAGFLKMLPAVVDIYITPVGDDLCRVRITGTAKESLIKQRAGEGAVRRLLADEELRDGLRKNAQGVVFAYNYMQGIDRRTNRRQTFVLAVAAMVFTVLTAILAVFVLSRPTGPTVTRTTATSAATKSPAPVRHDDVALEASLPAQVGNERMSSVSSSYNNILTDDPDLAVLMGEVADAIGIDPQSTTAAISVPENEAVWGAFDGLQAQRYPGSNEGALMAKFVDAAVVPVTIHDRTVYNFGGGIHAGFVGDTVYLVYARDSEWLELVVGSLPN